MKQQLLKRIKKKLLRMGWLNSNNVQHYLNAIRKEDIFIVSYPKSGNTWVRFIIANLMTQCKQEISFRNIEQYVPNIHKSADNINVMPKGRRFIKSHYSLYDNYPKMIYIIRDGRDAMVSYYHYHLQRGFEGTFQQYLRSEQHKFFGKWSEHVTEALVHKEKYPDCVLIVRYEDLIEHPAREIRRIADFSAILYDNWLIDEVNRRCSFHYLKNNEAKYGGETDKTAHKIFFRKGQMQQWMDYYTDQDMNYFMQAEGIAMHKLGLS